MQKPAFSFSPDAITRHLVLIYGVVASVFGLIYLLITPFTGAAPDERAHFFRAYQITQGQLKATYQEGKGGGFLPVSLVNFTSGKPAASNDELSVYSHTKAYTRQKLNSDNETWVAFNNTAVYSPINYAPQIVGISIGRLLGLPPVGLFYLARLAGLLCWVIATTYLLSKLPYGRSVAFVLLLLPTMLFASSMISPDSVIYLAAATVAVLLIRIHHQRAYSSVAKVVAGGAMGLLAFVKPGYQLLALPLATIISPKDPKKYRYIMPLIFVLVGLLGLLWNNSFRHADVTLGQHAANPAVQAQLLVTHPFIFVRALFNTYATTASDHVAQGASITQNLVSPAQWLSAESPLWLLVLMYATLLFAFYWAPDRNATEYPKARKLILLGSIAGTFVAINLLLWIFYNATDSHVINGIQGRYFLSLLLAALPLVCFAAPTSRRFITSGRTTLLVGGTLTGLIGFTVVLLSVA